MCGTYWQHRNHLSDFTQMFPSFPRISKLFFNCKATTKCKKGDSHFSSCNAAILRISSSRASCTFLTISRSFSTRTSLCRSTAAFSSSPSACRPETHDYVGNSQIQRRQFYCALVLLLLLQCLSCARWCVFSAKFNIKPLLFYFWYGPSVWS